MASAEGWYTDEAIKLLYGDAYDQLQKNDGYVDDANDPEEPYRFLTQWSIRSPSASSNPNPLPLPNGHFIEKKYDKAYVEGFLLPRNNNINSTGDEVAPPLKIKLALQKDDWIAFDRSKDYRGFWLMRPGALYWLQEPDRSIDAAMGAKKSQEQVHFDHIAWLAVLSNLMDAVFDFTPQAAQWANKSVTDVYEQLKTPANNDQPPFDKDLLVRYKEKIKPHLIGAQKYLTKNCAFIKSLNSMKMKPKITRQQIEASTKAAQERSRQYPWGEPTPEGRSIAAENQPLASSESALDDIDSDSSSAEEAALSREELALLASQGKADRSRKKKKRKNNVSLDTVQAVASKPKKLKRTSKKKSARKTAELESDSDYDSEYSEPRTKRSNKDTSRRREASVCSEEGKKDGVECSDVKEVATSSRKRKRPKQQAPPLFSGDEMGKALEFCEPFLHPKPSNTRADPSSWASVIDQEFGVRGDEEAKRLLQAARKWGDEKKPEWHLLVVEAFRQSCIRGSTKIMKKMFSKEEYASILFNQWRRHAMAKAQEKKFVEGTTEVFLLTSIVGLIAECKYIKSKNLLDKIKARGVDWQVIVDEVVQFNKETVGQSQKLQEACAAAQEWIDRIIKESPKKDIDASAVATAAPDGKLEQQKRPNATGQHQTTETRTQTGSDAIPLVNEQQHAQQSSFSVESGSSQKRRPSVGFKTLLKKLKPSLSGGNRPTVDVAKSGTDTAASEAQDQALVGKDAATATRKDEQTHETAEETRRKKLEDYIASQNSSAKSPPVASDSTSNAPSKAAAVSSATTSSSAPARQAHAWVDPPDKYKKWGSKEPYKYSILKPISLTITSIANLQDLSATDVGSSPADTTDAKGQNQVVVKKDTVTDVSKTDCSHKSAEEEEDRKPPATARDTENGPTNSAMPSTTISTSAPARKLHASVDPPNKYENCGSKGPCRDAILQPIKLTIAPTVGPLSDAPNDRPVSRPSTAKKESSESRRQQDPLVCPPKADPAKVESNKPRPVMSSFASLADAPAPKPKVLSEELFGASRRRDGAEGGQRMHMDHNRRPYGGHSDDRRTADSRDRERSRSSSRSSDDWQSRSYGREPASSRGRTFDDDRRSSGREHRDGRYDRNRDHYREERAEYPNNVGRSDSSHRRRRHSNGYDSQGHVPPARTNDLPRRRSNSGGGMGRGKHKTLPAWMMKG